MMLTSGDWITIASCVLGSGTNDNRRLNSIEQSAMRSELFAATQDRTQHEHQLEVGKRYLAAGYNGAGHVRISQLKADYSRRLASDDWDY